MKTLQEITEILENLFDDEIMQIWNEYDAEINGDSTIYEFDDEFFTIFFTDTAEAARATYFGEISSWNAKYAKFNGYGNIVACNYVSDLISIYDLANHIERNQDNYDSILEG